MAIFSGINRKNQRKNMISSRKMTTQVNYTPDHVIFISFQTNLRDIWHKVTEFHIFTLCITTVLSFRINITWFVSFLGNLRYFCNQEPDMHITRDPCKIFCNIIIAFKFYSFYAFLQQNFLNIIKSPIIVLISKILIMLRQIFHAT